MRENEEMENKAYLETKCVLSGQKETPRTQEPWPERVPAKLACCLYKKEGKSKHTTGKTNKRASHSNLDMAVNYNRNSTIQDFSK